MGYQPNVVSKNDIVVINGTRFRVKYDFNKAAGDKYLLLKIEEQRPQEFTAEVETK